MPIKKIVSITIVLIALVVVFGFLASKSRDVKEEQSRMETFSSEVGGFSFEYPARYALIHTSDRHFFLIEDTKGNRDLINGEVVGEAPPSIKFDIYENTNTVSLEEWLNTSPDSSVSPESGQVIPITVGEKPGYLYAFDGLYQNIAAAVEHNGNIVQITGEYIADDEQITVDYQGILENITFN